jgi:CheY-like chemotaxis protein
MSQLRSMVITDEALIGTSISSMLQAHGSEIIPVNSVNEGLEAFAHHQPDVLVCDVDLLEGEGFLLVSLVRELEVELGWNATPAILVSASLKDLDLNQAIAAGFRRFLARPLESDRLIAAVTSLVE